jgi:hypothetical protein
MRRRKGMPTPSPTPRPTLSASLFGARADVVGAGVVLEDSGALGAELIGVMRLVVADVGEVFAIVVAVADEVTELELGESVMNIEPLSKDFSP